MHDLCMRPVSGRYDCNNIQSICIQNAREHNSFLHETTGTLATRSREPVSLFPEASYCYRFVPFSNNNRMNLAQRDRDTSHRDRKNWNTAVIDPTSIATTKKRRDNTVRRVRSVRGKLLVTLVIPWMCLKHGKVSPSKPQSLNYT